VTKTLREYLDNVMKISLDDFIMYNDMDSHLQKLKLCFQKCREYGIYGIFQGRSWALLFPRTKNYKIQRKYKES
jgi:hypothetical protein